MILPILQHFALFCDKKEEIVTYGLFILEFQFFFIFAKTSLYDQNDGYSKLCTRQHPKMLHPQNLSVTWQV